CVASPETEIIVKLNDIVELSLKETPDINEDDIDQYIIIDDTIARHIYAPSAVTERQLQHWQNKDCLH
ncbi:hypothetical protein HK096_011613, partial [Nowakowskiella sp. JEL0078]